ncbi:GumC family protein [Coraliomargarita sp. W4R72]
MSQPSRATPATFRFPIPIDPLRLLYGIRQRWVWFLVLPILLGLIGWVLGNTQAENRYSVSLQLIKSEVANTVQTSESGQAFKPRDLSDDTLLSTTYSTAVLNGTAARLDPPRSAGQVKSMVEIAKQRNTSLFYLTAHSRISPEDAINTITIWADEIIRFTNNLQREEARQMESFISEQLDSIELQLEQANRQILDYARKNNFVDVDQQTQSSLAALEDLRSRLANATIEAKTKDVQISRYRQELRAQSPLEADLKKKREELTFLRGRYTDENPMVKEKLYEIEYINKQLESVEDSDIEDLKNFTGSDLGNNLYLEIIALQNEKTSLENMIGDLTRRLAQREEEVANLPEKALRLSELKSRRNLLIDAQGLLDSRRKEASFYESKAPGYWRIFQTPSVDEVAISSQNVKAMLLGFVGTTSGLCLALLAAIIWELLQPGLRTPLEAAIATATLPIFNYVTQEAEQRSWWTRRLFPRAESELNERSLTSFWLTHAITNEGTERKRFLFAHTEVGAHESVFWQALLNLIQAEGQSVVFYNIDTNDEPEIAELKSHPAIQQWESKLDEAPKDPDSLVFVRLVQSPGVQDIRALREMDAYYLLNSPSSAGRDTTRHKSELLRKLLGGANGMLIIDSAAGRTLPRLIKWVELTVLNKWANRSTEQEES